MIAKLKRNISSWQDVWLFYQVLFLITVLPILIKCHTLPGLLNRLTPSSKKSKVVLDVDETRKKIIKYTDFVLGWRFGVWKLTCLKRSLVLYHLLRATGMSVQICFGIRLPDSTDRQFDHGHLEGHAWLRYNEDLFLEIDPDMTRTYKETYRYPVDHRQPRWNGSFIMMAS
jgi:hypothetical protein